MNVDFEPTTRARFHARLRQQLSTAEPSDSRERQQPASESSDSVQDQ
jgi:hypothetical protein